jgi:PAS domain-containing protein
VQLITIPAGDVAFRKQVEDAFDRAAPPGPDEFETHLRLLFPRAVVRRREISGEPAWYIYRDGGWRPELLSRWWDAAGLARIAIDRAGWLTDASATALGLLGIGRDELGHRHFTDFVVPGTVADVVAMLALVEAGHELSATVLLRPASGDVLAVDLHLELQGEALVGLLRLAEDVPAPASIPSLPRPPIESMPASDVAFRGYVQRAVETMPEPTPDGLALRLRRLYPHAQVIVGSKAWTVFRDRTEDVASDHEWWRDPDLPRVRYDARALIVEANAPAEALLGGPLPGHHWQEFVTPGSTEQVSGMLEILAKTGTATSRFRMPRADGTLVEFDSHTQLEGDDFVTVMRPREAQPEHVVEATSPTAGALDTDAGIG